MNLATTAAMWPTPHTDSFRSRGGDRRDEKGLDRMARDWPTPMATDGNKPSAGNRKTADLTHASQMWMTPTARDHKDGATTLANTSVNGLLGRQVLVTPMAGSGTCDARRTLNPLFVEALAVRYDQARWLAHFDAVWPAGSPAATRSVPTTPSPPIAFPPPVSPAPPAR